MPTDLSVPRQVRDVLSRHGVWLTKARGQHLLVDREVLQWIVDAAELRPDDEVLEVGPGAGVLTLELSRRAKRVVAIEVDPRLVAVLRETVPAPNVEIVEGDALAVDPGMFFFGRSFKFVANLPYNVATALIRKLLYASPERRPNEMVVMIQREVAQRLAARPGNLSRLGVETQLVADVELLFEVAPESFFPPPDVTSAVVRLRPLGHYRVPPLPNEHRFFQTVEAGFGQKRKQIHNALGSLGAGTERIAEALARAGIDPKRRAETLTLEEWSRLSQALWEQPGEVFEADSDEPAEREAPPT
ncbi:MAG: ribosomal RNA small subunit methyltransferase A [Chloroflexi bacterium]|nr:ribosomal RNA small subunit methyltransferase A [Chloroflexota bacterium]